jgi:hypothetical protein
MAQAGLARPAHTHTTHDTTHPLPNLVVLHFTPCRACAHTHTHTTTPCMTQAQHTLQVPRCDDPQIYGINCSTF